MRGGQNKIAFRPHTRAGFTVVEMIVIIVVIGILVSVAGLSLTSVRIDARDSERKEDIDAIASHFETLYDLTPSQCFGAVCNSSGYPLGYTTLDSSSDVIYKNLQNTALRSPNNNDSATVSIVKATNTAQTTAGVTPQPTVDQYVLQPLIYNGASWVLCDVTNCRKFNLYYRTEADNTVRKVTSKHQ